MLIAKHLQIRRNASEALYETVLVREDGEELFLTATPLAGEGLAPMMARVGRHLRQLPWRAVGMTVFTGATGSERREELLRAAFGAVEWPVTWLQTDDDSCDGPAGVEVHAVNGPEVRTIRLRTRTVGCAWEDAAARHCELGDLRDEQTAHSPLVQTRQVLEDMAAALRQANMEFRHVYRTWFRNRDILGWYGDFNRVRTEFFSRTRVFDGLLPASTGIGAANSGGAALVCGLWAMHPKAPDIEARAMDSPLQGSATKYGSSFSRAVEVDLGDHRRLTISGTASIAPAGETLHVGDVAAQVELTMRVVRAILNSRGMDWAQVTRGVAYFRQSTDRGSYLRWCQANNVKNMPVIVSHHTLCRDDLLYETEIDAVADVS
jgi:enamine deaminase RidA (YjgF/YER057c/UK114 family)